MQIIKQVSLKQWWCLRNKKSAKRLETGYVMHSYCDVQAHLKRWTRVNTAVCWASERRINAELNSRDWGRNIGVKVWIDSASRALLKEKHVITRSLPDPGHLNLCEELRSRSLASHERVLLFLSSIIDASRSEMQESDLWDGNIYTSLRCFLATN